MNALNQVILEGNLTMQPNLRELKNGRYVCTLPIAVNRRYKTADGQVEDEVSYVEVSTFGGLAETCAKWCPKGRGIRVVGRIKQDRWKDETGKNRSKVHIIAEHIEFKPFFQKNEDGSPSESDKGPVSADAGKTAPSPTKKQKLAMLAEAAAAAQSEQEEGEEVVF